MGIEPTRASIPKLENTGFAGAPRLRCDWRMNFRGMWRDVGMREEIRRLLTLWRQCRIVSPSVVWSDGFRKRLAASNEDNSRPAAS
jgi:hypothetical protein